MIVVSLTFLTCIFPGRFTKTKIIKEMRKVCRIQAIIVRSKFSRSSISSWVKFSLYVKRFLLFIMKSVSKEDYKICERQAQVDTLMSLINVQCTLI